MPVVKPSSPTRLSKDWTNTVVEIQHPATRRVVTAPGTISQAGGGYVALGTQGTVSSSVAGPGAQGGSTGVVGASGSSATNGPPLNTAPMSWTYLTKQEVTSLMLDLYGPYNLDKMKELLGAPINNLWDQQDRRWWPDGGVYITYGKPLQTLPDGWKVWYVPQFGQPLRVHPDGSFDAVWISKSFLVGFYRMYGLSYRNPPQLRLGKALQISLPLGLIAYMKQLGVYEPPTTASTPQGPIAMPPLSEQNQYWPAIQL